MYLNISELDTTRIKKLYSNLINDIEFDVLELGLKKPNIFQILNISKKEIRHSNFLAWLLDPNESHKIGGVFLKRFLREVFSSSRFEEIDQIAVEGLDISNAKIYREWNNIDILIIVDGIIICIENKVGSKEHSNQLERYKKIVQNQYPKLKKTYVYLNPEGLDSVDQSEYYHPIGYNFIVDSLERILEIYDHSINERVKNYISDYLIIIKREIMNNDKLIKTAVNIYENHKELFDFIIENKPDHVDRLQEIFTSQILKRDWILGSTSKKYLRFTTSAIKELVYINKSSNGWKNKESYLLEFELYPSTNAITFKSVIAPSDENYNTSRLEEILREIDGFKKPIGKKWLCGYSEKTRFKYDDIPEKTDEDIEVFFNKFLDKVSPIVAKIENKFVEYSDELMQLKKTD